MIKDGASAFLQQACRNNWQQYIAALQPDARDGWDLCVLTASDEQQASVYQRQLAQRRETGLLPRRTRFVIFPDPPGQRIGSGGATLRALARLAADPDEYGTLAKQRVLLIHSGGDSRRLPHCSASGKLFARVPRTLPNGRASTLFDEFLISLSGVSLSLPPGVLVASGDVLLVFDHLQLDLNRPGVVGVAVAAPAETGTHHGVYVLAHKGKQGDSLHGFLHKPSMARLRQYDAISADGTVNVDTGLVWLDGPTVTKLVALSDHKAVSVFCGALDGDLATGLNLYGDLLMPLVPTTSRADYVADTSDGPATSLLCAAREEIWEQLRGVAFSVESLSPAVFAHFGTSREYWQLLTNMPLWALASGWTHVTASWSQSGPGAEQSAVDGALTLINAYVSSLSAGEGEGSLIIDSHLAGPLKVQGGALVAGLRSTRNIELAPNVVVHQLPVDGGFVTRIYGLDDDPKRVWTEPEGTVLGQRWSQWLAQAGLQPEEVWPNVPPLERTLWNAQLYPLARDREESLALSLPLQAKAARRGWKARWLAAPRLSLEQSFRQADQGLLAELTAVEDAVAAQRFYRACQAERPAAEIRALLGPGHEACRRANLVADLLLHTDPLLRLRGYEALAVATDDGSWEDRAFSVLADMIEDTVTPLLSFARDRNNGYPAFPSVSAKVRVRAAARLDFGGGWTDTPPYSIERGGTVLNAAITLNGEHPIIVEGHLLDEPRLVLQCDDIGAQIELDTLAQVLAYDNPADPFALLKAALVLRGIVPAAGDDAAPLSGVMGCGLHVCTRTSIPRGSGLGTSSILAGAVLVCLAELLGIELGGRQLYDEVLCLEQMMTTGGGWQDQVGGLVGGIKLVSSWPGLPQRLDVAPVALSDATRAELASRMALVYTGQRRLAKDLLRKVMGRWMGRDPEVVWIQGEIARLALDMRDALQVGDLDLFGELLGEHWALNKRMDPGCTNPFIDRLFEVMAPHICGGKLAGAGGGGFALVVTGASDTAPDLSDVLARAYPGTGVAIWPCAVPVHGIVKSRF